MQKNLFIHFPENEDIILSLATAEINVIDVLANFLTNMENKADFSFFYDNQNISKFLNGTQIVKPDLYLNNPSLQIKNLLGSKISKNIQDKTHNFVDTASQYYQWLNKKLAFSCDFYLSSVSERCFKNEPTFILDLSGDLEIDRSELFILKDALQISDCPKIAKIPVFTDIEEFRIWQWQEKQQNPLKFSLLNRSIFSKTNHKYNGAAIYKEIATGYHWYLDTFHDYVEYEVFNSNGKCIGVANSKGEIDSSEKTMKKVGNRTISL